jgi:hypothetical protein
MFEYAALNRNRSTPPRRAPEPSMKARVDALLAAKAETAICVRMHKLKKAIDSLPPGVLRRARLERQMREWLETQTQLGRGLAVR